MTDTQVNDYFWFSFDDIAQYLGYKDEEDFDRKRDPNYIDDDDLVDYCDEWFHEIIDDLKAQGDEKSYNLLDCSLLSRHPFGRCERDHVLMAFQRPEGLGHANHNRISSDLDGFAVLDAMQIISEMPLRDFDFWSGAEERAAKLTDDEFDSVEKWFEEMYPDGIQFSIISFSPNSNPVSSPLMR